jgi:hypothetical protein
VRAVFEVTDPQPGFAVQESEYRRLLGFPADHAVPERAAELMAWARAWYRDRGRPWLHARRAGDLSLADGRVAVGAATFAAPGLHARLVEAEAESVALVAVSAGAECEEEARRLWEAGKPDEYFFLEVYGSAVVEALVAASAFRLCEWADDHALAVLPHYSPGYPAWDIAEQSKLLDLLDLGRRGLPSEVRVLETGMLRPKKSLLAVFGLTRHVDRVRRLTTLVPCANCSLPGCRYRRSPYRKPMHRVEAPPSGSASAERGEGEAPPTSSPDSAPALTRGAAYSLSPRALELWARDRLQLRVLDDRSVEARFRYSGTTCSNMGRALEFDYHVRLAPPEAGYVITALECAPAPGDAGHTYMCGYIEDADALMAAIGGERPLLGRPLDDVLRWRRDDGAAGCYCEAASREHKWGVALEVLHYALSREGATATTGRGER